MATVWLEQQTSSSMAQNGLKPTVNKRKRTDHDNISNKRKIVINSMTKNDSDDDDERLSLPPRVSPILPKNIKSFKFVNRSLSSMTLFTCQLCRRYLKNKDVYMDHMIVCAVQRQASIKIVRAEKDKHETAIL